MTFLHVAFLGGALAIAVPIVLHLIMRKQPKHLEFPALRFIKLRESANRRQMRLRHWLLLALRCALIGLLALALARPSIVASGMLGDQEAPLAAALVFDTNPRMQYRQNNQTRLEVAQETAGWLLPQLPADSEVAVVDSRSGTAAFAVDLGAARQRIERLNANMMSQPLSVAVESAVRLVGESSKQRKEVYIFTDLSRAAWSADAMRAMSALLRQQTGVGVYVIDVGVIDPSNFGF
ncbi:MAG: BatA domain-containing protein, partial [Pirellulales bacterium]